MTFIERQILINQVAIMSGLMKLLNDNGYKDDVDDLAKASIITGKFVMQETYILEYKKNIEENLEEQYHERLAEKEKEIERLKTELANATR